MEIGQVHRHYKGGRYLLMAVATTHEHNGDQDAVYVSLTHGTVVTRPYRCDSRCTAANPCAWLDSVRWPDGAYRPRFIREDMLSQRDLFALQTKWNEIAAREVKVKPPSNPNAGQDDCG